MLVFNKVSFSKKGFKYFIGYKDAKKLDFHRRDFDETKYMSFLIENEELLEKFNEK